MNTKNSKTNEQHKFVFDLWQRLKLRSSNKHVALENFITPGKIWNNSKRTIKPK